MPNIFSGRPCRSLRLEHMPLLHINTAVTIIRTELPKNCQRPPPDLHTVTTGNEPHLQLEEIQVPNTASPRIMPCEGQDQQPEKTPVLLSVTAIPTAVANP